MPIKSTCFVCFLWRWAQLCLVLTECSLGCLKRTLARQIWAKSLAITPFLSAEKIPQSPGGPMQIKVVHSETESLSHTKKTLPLKGKAKEMPTSGKRGNLQLFIFYVGDQVPKAWLKLGRCIAAGLRPSAEITTGVAAHTCNSGGSGRRNRSSRLSLAIEQAQGKVVMLHESPSTTPKK